MEKHLSSWCSVLPAFLFYEINSQEESDQILKNKEITLNPAVSTPVLTSAISLTKRPFSPPKSVIICQGYLTIKRVYTHGFIHLVPLNENPFQIFVEPKSSHFRLSPIRRVLEHLKPIPTNQTKLNQLNYDTHFPKKTKEQTGSYTRKS